jgi:hypothetical protein
MQFTSWEELHKKGKVADAILICVLVRPLSHSQRD